MYEYIQEVLLFGNICEIVRFLVAWKFILTVYEYLFYDRITLIIIKRSRIDNINFVHIIITSYKSF